MGCEHIARDNRDTHIRKERAAQGSGAIQLRLTDGFASFTDENYGGAYGSPACRAPIGRALSGPRRASRVRSVVLFHTPLRVHGRPFNTETKRAGSTRCIIFFFFFFFFISFHRENVQARYRRRCGSKYVKARTQTHTNTQTRREPQDTPA